MITDSGTATCTSSYVDWCTILAGTVVATALSLIFLQFGSGIGLADTDMIADNVADVTPARLVMAGVYILLIQVICSLVGGYIAGRLRAPVAGATAHEREMRDGMHGLLVWATATVLVFMGGALVAAFAAMSPGTVPEVQVTQDILEREKVVGIILAFSAGATSLVSAVAAWGAATKGGDHRDRQIDFSHHFLRKQ
jgi:MFS family permease